LHIILEATETYHEIMTRTLFDAGCKVSVVNPAYTKNFARSLGIKTKIEKVDADVLARFGVVMQTELQRWQPSPAHYQWLKHLHNRKHAVEIDIRRECNRLEKLQSTYSEACVIKSIKRMA